MVVMNQSAPYPHSLQDTLLSLSYKNGWSFELRDMVRDPINTHGAEGRGLTLIISIVTPDSYNKRRTIQVNHYFIVPAATYHITSWRRWLLDCILKVEQHEACEFFTLWDPEVDDERVFVKPFAPLHGPGEDPYRIVEYATGTQRRTSFRGELNPS